MQIHALILAGLLISAPPVNHTPSHTPSHTPVAAPAAPCTTATTACEQWIVYGSGPARSFTYSSYPLDKPNATVTRALIMVHGAGRNADHYFTTALAAAFLAGALENTIIVAPRLIASPDKPEANEVLWANSWRSGGISPTHPTLNSFDFIDEVERVEGGI
jgi:hypothetical protein